MCNAFSCIVQQNGNVLWKFAVDSHDELLTLYGALYGLSDTIADQQTLSFARVEVVPANANYLTPDRWILKVDQAIKPYWWGPAYETYVMDAHRQWLTILDKILVRKPTVNPLTDIKAGPVTKESLKLLKEWASARDSVWASVWDSVRASVWDSVGDSVRDNVRASVRASVGDSVGDNVRDSVRASVRASVWDSVGAYQGSLFNLPRTAWQGTETIKTAGYPFESSVKLWEAGLVPSFDGQVWRLHAEPHAGVVCQWTP